MADLMQAPKTMTSLEISTVVEKRHDNVKRTIETLGERGVITLPQIEEVSNPGPGPKKVEVYHVGKRDSFVVVAQLSPEFTARLVDRWQELEEGARQVTDPVAILNDPTALRGLLLQNVEKVIALEAKVEADKPKTSFYDRYANAEGLYGLQNAGRALNARPNLFCRWLKRDYLFYQGGNLVPRVRFLQIDLFEVKSELVDGRARPQTYVTPKGLQYLASRVPEEIKLTKEAA